MIDNIEFRKWLISNTDYTDEAINDVVSRMKRADRMLEWDYKETYIFYLEKNDDFMKMSVSVKSQLRRAVKYYIDFWRSSNQEVIKQEEN